MREAFSQLVQSQGNRDYIVEVGQELMSRLLRSANKVCYPPTLLTLALGDISNSQDPQEFQHSFHDILHYVEDPSNWSQTEAELSERGVSNSSTQNCRPGPKLAHKTGPGLVFALHHYCALCVCVFV